METSVVTVRCVDVNSKKSPIGSICVHYANELKNDILARRPLGTETGRTAPTDVTLGTP